MHGTQELVRQWADKLSGESGYYPECLNKRHNHNCDNKYIGGLHHTHLDGIRCSAQLNGHAGGVNDGVAIADKIV